MPKPFSAKMSLSHSPSNTSYVVATCPKCGKLTYGVAGQKGKKCTVCRRSFPMPSGANAPQFPTPEAARRFIQAEEAKKAGRLDFAPATPAFSPTAPAPIITRTPKVVAEAPSMDAQFAAWARRYFSLFPANHTPGLPTNVVVAAAAKAGFVRAESLINGAVGARILWHPKPYLTGLTTRERAIF